MDIGVYKMNADGTFNQTPVAEQMGTVSFTTYGKADYRIVVTSTAQQIMDYTMRMDSADRTVPYAASYSGYAVYDQTYAAPADTNIYDYYEKAPLSEYQNDQIYKSGDLVSTPIDLKLGTDLSSFGKDGYLRSNSEVHIYRAVLTSQQNAITVYGDMGIAIYKADGGLIYRNGDYKTKAYLQPDKDDSVLSFYNTISPTGSTPFDGKNTYQFKIKPELLSSGMGVYIYVFQRGSQDTQEYYKVWTGAPVYGQGRSYVVTGLMPVFSPATTSDVSTVKLPSNDLNRSVFYPDYSYMDKIQVVRGKMQEGSTINWNFYFKQSTSSRWTMLNRSNSFTTIFNSYTKVPFKTSYDFIYQIQDSSFGGSFTPDAYAVTDYIYEIGTSRRSAPEESVPSDLQ